MDQDIDQLWENEQGICEQIYEQGFEKYLKGLDQYEQAFQLKDKAIRCIDEGTPGGIHLAGSGILLSLREAGRIIEEAGDIEGIYSHENCGAVALHAQNQDHEQKDPDKIGKRFAKEIAAETNETYLGHITSAEMNRPAGFHNARVIYYDGTGNFDYSRVEGLPTGFTISREYLYSEYAQKELDISLDIAFGDHGFGDRFDEDNPLIIVLLDYENEEKKIIDMMKQEVKDVIKNYNSDKIQVETYLRLD